MMNVVVASSECSSGCESGWTLYLDHSTSNYSRGYNKNQTSTQNMASFDNHTKNVCSYEDDDDEVEDLSMVSDASSGPPHFDHDIDDEDEEEDNTMCYISTYDNSNYSNNSGRLRKQRNNKSYSQMQCSKVEDFALDDTASSVVFTSKKSGGVNVENQGSSYERYIDYSSQGYSANHLQGTSSNFQERYAYIQSPYSTERFHQHNQLS